MNTRELNMRVERWLADGRNYHRYRVVRSPAADLWVVFHHHGAADGFPRFRRMSDACQWAEDQARMDADLHAMSGAG